MTPACETFPLLVNADGHFMPARGREVAQNTLKTDGDASKPCAATAMERDAAFDVPALCKAIRVGDEKAFAQFYERYSARLYRLLLLLTSGGEETAREVFQVAMIKVARKFRVFSSEAELWAWVSQVARNALVDHFRHQARRPDHTGAELLDEITIGTESGERELLVWLENGLKELEPEERDLVQAVYFERQAQQQIADAGATTRKAIESRLARIRAKLREYVLKRMKHEA